MEKVLVGVVTKPQALKGAFRIKPNIWNLKKFKKMTELIINNVSYAIESMTLRDTFVIAKLKGVDSCEEAEKFRNLDVYAELDIDKTESINLVGFQVTIADKCGIIKEVNNYGAHDILTIQIYKECMVPVINGLIENIDTNANMVVINPEIFEQVVVYED